MRRVIIESPFAGDIRRNVAYARRALLDCLLRDEAPLASHLLYTQVLNDSNPIDRKLGIEAGLEWMLSAEAVVLYVDYGKSPGMCNAEQRARAHGLDVFERRIGQNGSIESIEKSSPEQLDPLDTV